METRFRTSAWALSIAGILPFVVPVFWFYFSNDDVELIERAQLYMVAYGAVILSFLGGVRWGVSLNSGSTVHLYWSVVPALLGWACLLAPVPYQLPALLFGFLTQWFWDYRSAKTGVLPIWFGLLRSFISICVVSLIALTIYVSIFM